MSVISQAGDKASSWQPNEGYNVMLNTRVCQSIVFTFLASKKGLGQGLRDLLDPGALNTISFQRSSFRIAKWLVINSFQLQLFHVLVSAKVLVRSSCLLSEDIFPAPHTSTAFKAVLLLIFRYK